MLSYSNNSIYLLALIDVFLGTYNDETEFWTENYTPLLSLKISGFLQIYNLCTAL